MLRKQLKKEEDSIIAGTKSGGLKVREKNLAKDPLYYVKLGQRGAAAYNAKPVEERLPRGFSVMTPKERSELGRKGGKVSRRTGVKNAQADK